MTRSLFFGNFAFALVDKSDKSQIMRKQSKGHTGCEIRELVHMAAFQSGMAGTYYICYVRDSDSKIQPQMSSLHQA